MTESQPRVLVIDDDAALLRMIRLVLVAEGMSVVTASDGSAGLEALDAGDFDVIVLDLQMPRMDGRTFYREMETRHYDVKVLILSANGADQARRELNAAASLAKPFDPERLASTVQSLAAANGTPARN